MTQALSGPFLIAALTLCVAAVAKLRSPAPAAEALRTLRLRSSGTLVRVLAAGELALGLAAAIEPGAATCAALGCVYATFAAVTLLLHRLGAGCGCFGESRAPASPGQSALSAALAIVCGTAAFTHVHGAAWIVGRSPALAAVLVVGIIGAVFAIAATYSELPAAWEAWSGR